MSFKCIILKGNFFYIFYIKIKLIEGHFKCFYFPQNFIRYYFLEMFSSRKLNVRFLISDVLIFLLCFLIIDSLLCVFWDLSAINFFLIIKWVFYRQITINTLSILLNENCQKAIFLYKQNVIFSCFFSSMKNGISAFQTFICCALFFHKWNHELR